MGHHMDQYGKEVLKSEALCVVDWRGLCMLAMQEYDTVVLYETKGRQEESH